jgi:hypothetical protein
MKSILKTIPTELDMNYEKTFNNNINIEIRRKLIPELIKSLSPKHRVSHDQIDDWLQTLHRSRRSRNNYRNKGKLESDNRRLHANGRLSEV